jgi:hypothetical protein
MAASKCVAIEQWEHFQKQTYRSRCHILSANGVQILSIPVVKNHGSKMPIRDVQIDYSQRWQMQHWRALTAAYNNSPFFVHYADDLRPFYERHMRFLFDFNLAILQKIIAWLGLDVEIILTDVYKKSVKCDFRSIISPKNQHSQHNQHISFPPYYQRFSEQYGYVQNLSIIDLLSNEGNDASIFTAKVIGAI